MRRRGVVLVLGLLRFAAAAGASVPTSQVAEPPPVVVDYFFEPGCPECEQVRREVLPELASRFSGFYALNAFDINAASNVARLVAYQKALGMSGNEPVSMVVDYRYPFAGVRAIREGLLERVERSAVERLAPGWRPPEPIPFSADAGEQLASVRRRAEAFTLTAVLVGGLTDGINPCAISTLVFFMSLLAVAKVGGRHLLAMGAAFCLASFATYTLLGLGLLQVLHAFAGFRALRGAVDVVLAAALLVMACLSFRDGWRFRRSRNPADVALQLPDRIKRRIHDALRTGVRARNLAAAGVTLGVLVTLLESVCTGQVYLPTLVVVARSGQAGARVWAYLLLYNAMFIVPLLVAFVLTYRGVRTQALLEWSARNVFASKMLMALFFLAMAALVMVL